ncbi:MAG: efflux RND transporter periplasmic adaptor subunit, partial [Actinomycetota bacterium]
AEEVAAAEAQVRSAEAALSAARTAANRSEVDDADLAAAKGAVRQAQDGLRAAEASRVEMELADSDIRAAQAAYNQAVAAYELAGQQIDSADIVSPLDGIATQVAVNPGEMAGPGMPLMTVVGSAGAYLEAAAPSRVLQGLRAGQPATVTVDSLRGKTFAGRVTSVGAVAGPDGRTFPVRIDLSAPAGALKPGAAARATVVTETYPEAVTVPEAALRLDGERTAVWVVRDGKVTEVLVAPGVQADGRTMVRGDVRPGEPVVLSTDTGVRPGQSVRVEMEAQ